MTTLNPLSGTDFEDSEFSDSEFDDCYDEFGNVSDHGLFDAGGHPIGERWADYADAIRDRMKEER